MLENYLAHRRAHRDFENAGPSNVAADADKFQSARAVRALRDKPIDTAHQDLRHVDERFHIVDDRRLLPQTDLSRKRRLVARLGAMAFDRFDERAFFSADVAPGTDKDFKIELEFAAEDFLSE